MDSVLYKAIQQVALGPLSASFHLSRGGHGVFPMYGIDNKNKYRHSCQKQPSVTLSGLNQARLQFIQTVEAAFPPTRRHELAACLCGFSSISLLSDSCLPSGRLRLPPQEDKVIH